MTCGCGVVLVYGLTWTARRKIKSVSLGHSKFVSPGQEEKATLPAWTLGDLRMLKNRLLGLAPIRRTMVESLRIEKVAHQVSSWYTRQSLEVRQNLCRLPGN